MTEMWTHEMLKKTLTPTYTKAINIYLCFIPWNSFGGIVISGRFSQCGVPET